VVQQVMRHASISQTMDTYRHPLRLSPCERQGQTTWQKCLAKRRATACKPLPIGAMGKLQNQPS
ncbi:MAG: hypothetical protein VB877_10295, partial [Pirellulaceae bacterium]